MKQVAALQSALGWRKRQIADAQAKQTQEPIACIIDGKLMAYSNDPLPKEGLLYLAPSDDWNAAIAAMQGQLDALRPAFGPDTLASFYALLEGLKR